VSCSMCGCGRKSGAIIIICKMVSNPLIIHSCLIRVTSFIRSCSTISSPITRIITFRFRHCPRITPVALVASMASLRISPYSPYKLESCISFKVHTITVAFTGYKTKTLHPPFFYYLLSPSLHTSYPTHRYYPFTLSVN